MSEHAARDTILAEARALFMRQGFAGTSVRDICRRANVTAPVLYYHFGNKRGLFQAVVEETLSLDDFAALLRRATSVPADPSRRMLAFVRTYLAHYPVQMLNPGLHLSDSMEVTGASLRLLAGGIETIYDLARQILREGVTSDAFRQVNIDTAAACLMGSVDSFVRARVFLGADFDVETLAEQVVDLFARGLIANDNNTSA